MVQRREEGVEVGGVIKLALKILFILALIYFGLTSGTDDSGMFRNYCRADLKKAVRISDVIYPMEIVSSTPEEITYFHDPQDVRPSKYILCNYEVKLGTPIKTTTRYRLFGEPSITSFGEIPNLPSSFDKNNFWGSQENPQCRPNGHYLFFGLTNKIFSSDWREHLRKSRPNPADGDIGNGDCNNWAVISGSYADETKSLLKQK